MSAPADGKAHRFIQSDSSLLATEPGLPMSLPFAE